MKEIKFRGKKVITDSEDDWVVGDLLRPGTIIPLWDREDPRAPVLSNLDFIPVHEDSIGQYIGQDKEANEVFEGDIVEQEFSVCDETPYHDASVDMYGWHRGVVSLTPSGAVIKRPIFSITNQLEDETRTGKLKGNKAVVLSRCRVVGNIIDNPELLEFQNKEIQEEVIVER